VVASPFSDPAWWPKPPPKPPKSLPKTTIIFGTIVPVVVGVGLAVALFHPESHHSSDALAGRSSAAFLACLSDQGVLTPSAEGNDAMLQQAAVACRGHVPIVGKTAADVQQALNECLQSAQSQGRTSLRPFRSGPGRSSFERAQAICRAQAFAEPAGSPGSGQAPVSIA
jgi:hypothetical protein